MTLFARTSSSAVGRHAGTLLAAIALAGVGLSGIVVDSANAAAPSAEQGQDGPEAHAAPLVTVPSIAPVSFTQTTLTQVTPPPPSTGSRDDDTTASVDAGSTGSAGVTGWPSTAALHQAAREIGLDPSRFVLADKGSWGLADWYHDTVYIAPRTPAARLRSVLIHEQAHLDHARTYGGDINALTADANRVFGGSGLKGAERAADCIALLRGASWTNYTGCSDPAQQDAARALAAGRRL